MTSEPGPGGKEIYTLEPVDECLDRSGGLQCGYPEAEHPLNLGGFTHEFKPGAKDFSPVRVGDVPAGSPVLDANGDPVPGLPSGDIPEQVQRLFYGGRVPARECPHYIASSEDQAGFTECEGCSGKQ